MINTEDYLRNLLLREQEKNSSFIEISKAVNNNFSRAALYKLLLFSLERVTAVKKVALFVHEDNWSLKINKGNQDIAKNIDVAEDLKPFLVIQNIKRYKAEKFKGFEYLIPIVHKRRPLAYLLVGEMELFESDSADEILKFVETICSFVISSIENKRLAKSAIEEQRISGELKLARQVQKMLIPDELPSNHFISAGAFYKPHGSIGGDYYDIMAIDDDHIGFCMCDVSGKGVAAGLIMANFQAQLRAFLMKYSSLEQLIDHLNFKLYNLTKGEKYITMFLGVYDVNNCQLHYVSTGHNPTYLYQMGDITELKKGSTLLGAFDRLPHIEVGNVSIGKDAMLVAYTDGLTEQENELNEMFGEERLTHFIFENHAMDTPSFVVKLEQEIIQFKGDKLYNDDISVLTIRFK